MRMRHPRTIVGTSVARSCVPGEPTGPRKARPDDRDPGCFERAKKPGSRLFAPAFASAWPGHETAQASSFSRATRDLRALPNVPLKKEGSGAPKGACLVSEPVT